MTQQKDELAEALQRKDLEIEEHLKNLTEQEIALEQRDDIIRILTEKEGEQMNIIKEMRRHLEIRTQAEAEVSFA